MDATEELKQENNSNLFVCSTDREYQDNESEKECVETKYNQLSEYTVTSTDSINELSTTFGESSDETEAKDYDTEIDQLNDDEKIETEIVSENKKHYDNDTVNVHNLEESEESRLCDPCHFDDIREIANSFCTVCVEYLCKTCARDHRRSKTTRTHKILIDLDMPDNPKWFKMMKSLVACPDHPEMEVSFKCKTHEKFICTKCLVISHRKCDEVIEISNQTTSEGEQMSAPASTYTLLPITLQSVHEMTVSVRHAKEENFKQLKENSTSILKERSQYIQCLQEQLLILDEKSAFEIEAIVAKTLSELENDIARCKDVEMKETQQKCFLDVALNYGNSTEIVIVGEKVEKDIKAFKAETAEQKDKPEVSLKFERNKSFEEITSAGSVCVVKGKNEERNSEKTPMKEAALELSSDELGEHSFKAEEDTQIKSLMQSSVSKRRIMYDIQSKTTEQVEKCSITGMFIMSDGRVVLTDYSNERIKVLNLDFTIQTEREIGGKPIDICRFSGNNLAVIVDGVKVVKKYSIADENMHDNREFPCKLFPISIGNMSVNDDQIVILFSDEERKTPKKSDYDTIEIQVRNINNGKILKTFTDFRSKSSQKMVLENPARICMMPKTEDAFFISENMKMHCMATDQDNRNVLEEKWYFKSYKGSIIEDISDIVVDKEGNIYVCGKSSKNIHQISGSNYMKNRVLLTVSGTPLSLCLDDDNRQLIVGCEDDDFIYVIKLE